MTLASSGIKRRQLPPSITAAPCREGEKEEEWWEKKEGWMRRIREQTDGKPSAPERSGGSSHPEGWWHISANGESFNNLETWIPE